MNRPELSYEEALAQLQEIVEELEDANSTMDKSLEAFKRGVELYKHCTSLLSKAEGEIKILLEDDGGDIEEVDYPMGG